MRVLMISDVYFPRVNGVSTSIKTFRDEFAGLGMSSLLAAPAYPGQAMDADPDVLRLPSRQVPRDPEDRLMKRGAVQAWRRSLRRGEFDLVHIQTPFLAHYAGVAVARDLGVPVVASYHTYFEHYLQHYVPWLPARLTQFMARRFTVSQCHAVDTVIAPSTQMATALERYGVRTPIEVIPTGMPPSSFEPGNGARFRARHGIAVGRPMVAFVGRVAHEKNIGFLISMLPSLLAGVPDALLVIAGEGPARKHFERRVVAAGLGGHVRFLGYLDRSTELADCYRAADVFAFASRTETQGLVLLEAMAQGTPVVSTAVMGTIDVLAHAAGAVVVAEDEKQFAAAIGSLLQDPARRAELGHLALATARSWSSAELAAKLLTLYRRVCAERDVKEDSRRGHQPVAGDAHDSVT